MALQVARSIARMKRTRNAARSRLPSVFLLVVTAVLEPRGPVVDETLTPEQLVAFEERLVAASELALAASVGLHIRERGSVGDGSGVIVSPDGYVLTVAHNFARPGAPMTAVLADGRRVPAVGLGREGGSDYALVKLEGDGPWPFAPMGDSNALVRDELVVMTGHAGGIVDDRPSVVRVGTFAGRRQQWLRTDCAMMPGDSGGALFDMAGNVLGINSFIEENVDLNFHVPVELFRDNWDRLVAKETWNPARGEEERKPIGALGIYVRGIADGLEVRRLMSGYKAAESGIREGDVITAVDGVTITEAREFSALQRDAKIGTKMKLSVRRGTEVFEFELEIALREDN
jgi:serine protease Do